MIASRGKLACDAMKKTWNGFSCGLVCGFENQARFCKNLPQN